MRESKDISGNKYGFLTVIKKSHQNKENRWIWECVCDCGGIVYRPKNQLETKRISSCGCYKKYSSLKHGMHGTKEYSTWQSMKDRCLNINGKDYKNYMGRGIKICNRWKNSFVNFYNDMGPAPTVKHQIDRIDNDGPYCKDNCMWSTPKENSINKRSSKIWFIRGVYFESAIDAGIFWGVKDITINRWCNGGHRTRIKKDCFSLKRYKK